MRGSHRRVFRLFSAVVLTLAVLSLASACGGGGSGSGDNGPQTTAPPPPPRIRAEAAFANQWGLSTIRADTAYQQVEQTQGTDQAPGTGQTVGLIDGGIDRGHPVFAGKTVSEYFSVAGIDETGHRPSHGTAVASVIAARRGATYFDHHGARPAHGVAWGANIAMFAIPLSSGGPATYRPVSLSTLNGSDDDWAGLVNRVINWSSGALDFVNVSVGFSGIIEQYSEAELRANYDAAIAAYAQTGASEKTVFVFSAGNAHGDPCDPADFTGNADLCESYLDSNNQTKYRVNAKSVDIDAGLPVRISELREHLIAVVAVDEDGNIASFSNRCGVAALWCIAAPGVNVRAAYFGPDPNDNSPGARRIGRVSGTSFAAPMVTGALVVMKHRFRDQLSNTALVSRLYATANKQGIYANSGIYGQGLLDLGAATQAVGMNSVIMGNWVNGPGVDLSQTHFALGDALGDGLRQALAGQEIAAFDALGAPFWYGLQSFTEAAEPPSSSARLRHFMMRPQAEPGAVLWRPALGAVERDDPAAGLFPLGFGVLDAPAQGAGVGHLGLAGQALSVSAAGQGGLGAAAFSSEGLDGQAPVSGATLSWRPQDAPLGLRGGYVGERDGLLGSRTAGAFGRFSAGSAFVGVEGTARIGAWRIGAGAEVGTVTAQAQPGLIASVSPLTTSAFALQAARPVGEAGALTVSLAQPLRIEAGHALLSVPIGRTKDGRVRRRSVAADLEPTGRQIEVAAAWQRPLADGEELRLGAIWTGDPGHGGAAAPDLTLLAGWRHTF